MNSAIPPGVPTAGVRLGPAAAPHVGQYRNTPVASCIQTHKLNHRVPPRKAQQSATFIQNVSGGKNKEQK